jgi:uncharacterized membrane protein YfcA
MLDWLTQHTLIHTQQALWLAAAGAMLIGMAKAGLAGCGLASVLLFAEAFGAKTSTGVVLPLLIAADFMGYYLLRKAGKWRQIVPLVPPAIAGVVIGWWLLDKLDDHTARIIIGWIILLLVALKLVIDWKREQLKELHRHPVFTNTIGVLAGAVTMLSNAAGPVMTIYLLAKRSEKHEYLGVFTRFFLFINLVKVPFSVNMDLINPPSLLTNLALLPAVFIGGIIGWRVVKVMSQQVFEWLVFVFAIVAALRLVMG